MLEQAATTENLCSERDEIGAYLDGELCSNEELALELHLAGCKNCLAELNAQKRMLFALDSARDEKAEISLPENFAKVVAVRAESGVSGLRSKDERFNAAFLCAALFLIVMIALSFETEDVSHNFERFGEHTFTLINFIGHLIYNLGVGIAFIIRSLGGQIVYNSVVSFIIVAILFIFSAAALSNLIFRSNRS